jgi:hypothetical protein
VRRLLPAIVTGGLGLNLWVVLLGMPALHVGVGPLVWLACVLPLLPLVTGAAATLRPEVAPGLGKLAGPLLVLAYPIACVVPLVAERTLTGVNVYGPGNLLLAALSLVAFGVGTLIVLGRVTRTGVERRTIPIQGWTLAPDARRRQIGRIAMIVGAALVAASTSYAAFLRPGAAEDVAAAYGDGASGATIAIGAMALVLPLGVLLVYFGPPLRHPGLEEPLPPPSSRLRSTLALVLVGAAAAVALVLLRAGR